MSLRTRILLLVLFATFAPAIAFIFTSLRERDADVAQARQRLAATADRIAAELSDAVRATSQLHYGLSRAGVIDSGDREACSEFLAGALREHPQYTGLLTIRPDGRLFCDSLRSGRELDLTDRRYFREALASPTPLVLEAVFGRLTGIAVLQVAYGVRNADGAMKFVLLGSLNLEKFMETRSRDLNVESAVLALMDTKGTVLTWHPRNDTLRGSSLAGSALQGLARGRDTPDLEEEIAVAGVPRLWATSTLPQFPLAGLAVMVGAPRQALSAAAEARLRRTLTILAGVSLLAFIAALALTELGVRRQTMRIIDATRKLSLGDFSARVGTPYARGELGGVMAVLDATAARIEAQSGEILRLNEGLEQRVAERTSALEAALRQVEARTREVESQNRLLADADLYKSQFLANMTHELRTPLNAVMGHAELIESTPVADGASLQRHATQVREAAHDLNAIIDDLLELARIASGAERPHLDVVSARAVARDAVEAARPAAAPKRIGLALEAGAEIQCRADRKSMARLLQHLLANAIKFTPEGGQVAVRVSRENEIDGSEFVRFAVGDTGIGIGARDMGRLFAPFVQLEVGSERRFGGTGLGLALVKGLTELQGGVLTAESELGKGSTFSVRLPLRSLSRDGRHDPATETA
jgi:signal transduction histidine kinase